MFDIQGQDDLRSTVCEEDEDYLTKQIITYIGNKRTLLPFIGLAVDEVRRRLGKKKLICVDMFSGSGIVARYLKQYSQMLYANDIEDYACLMNACYLTNQSTVDWGLLEKVLAKLYEQIDQEWSPGFITDLYAPKNEEYIVKEDRVFYTRQNAIYIDTARKLIGSLPQDIQKFFLAPLLYEASVHANTSGVFKGFYKNSEGVGQFGGTGRNALSRILGKIKLELPVLSRFECEYQVLQLDAAQVVETLPKVDLVYMDPPYNQHPYGSNYFMLNLILHNRPPINMSRVSGIPNDWKRSPYNKRQTAPQELFNVIRNCSANFVLISYNSEGFVSYQDFIQVLTELGKVTPFETKYNTFRGCRNLRSRSTKVTEYLFLLERR